MRDGRAMNLRSTFCGDGDPIGKGEAREQKSGEHVHHSGGICKKMTCAPFDEMSCSGCISTLRTRKVIEVSYGLVTAEQPFQCGDKSRTLVSHSGGILGWRPLFKDKRKVITLCTREERQGGQIGFLEQLHQGLYTLWRYYSVSYLGAYPVSSNDKVLTCCCC